MMRKCIFLRLLGCIVLLLLPVDAEERIVNPITDICWECLTPITFGGLPVAGSKEANWGHQALCLCPGIPPKAGVPLTLWEPTYLVDVTAHSYKLLALGGSSIGKETLRNRGMVSKKALGSVSFHHVHLYRYPLLRVLDLGLGLDCLSEGELDVAWLSELDPSWNDEAISMLLHPEAALFESKQAHAACIADCITASQNVPTDTLFWCAGCMGSLYPFTGFVSHHTGFIQASSLLCQRMLAKLHRLRLLKGQTEEDLCEERYLPIWKKRIYKTQLAYPVPQTSGRCHPMGESDLIWGSGKSYPGKGEECVYVIWKRKQCCIDAVKKAAAAG